MINVYCEKCNKVTQHKAVVDVINDDIPVIFLCYDCETQKYSNYRLKFEGETINNNENNGNKN